MPDSIRSQGIHGSGPRDYTEQEAQRVIAALSAAQTGFTVEDIALLTGVGGRAVRQIISDHDGSDFLVGGGDDGMIICEWAEDAEGITHRIESQAHKMLDRAIRRIAYAADLPRRQEGLF